MNWKRCRKKLGFYEGIASAKQREALKPKVRIVEL
jgi:hypothetical protein